MVIQAIQGRDVAIDANSWVILRIQGYQWRLAKPSTGIAIFKGAWTRNLKYYGGKPITGDVWIGKVKHSIQIQPRG